MVLDHLFPGDCCFSAFAGDKSVNRGEFERYLNDLARKLGLNVTVVYDPNPYNDRHAEYYPNENLIIIYDENPSDAFKSFVHEVIELRLTPLINKYKKLINSLIEFYQSILDIEKEFLVESLVSDFNGPIDSTAKNGRGGRGQKTCLEVRGNDEDK